MGEIRSSHAREGYVMERLLLHGSGLLIGAWAFEGGGWRVVGAVLLADAIFSAFEQGVDWYLTRRRERERG